MFPRNKIKKREFHHGLHGAPFLAFKKNMDMQFMRVYQSKFEELGGIQLIYESADELGEIIRKSSMKHEYSDDYYS